MATAMIFTVFSACSKPTENDKPTTEAPTTAKATTGFNTDTEGLMTPDEVMNDASTVDLNHYMEVEGLKKVEEKDDESATGTIDYYDRNGNIVYKKYIGYGEDSFDYYIKSNSGKSLTVKYILEDGKTIGVNAECEDYTISFNKLDGSAKYGANDIYITSLRKRSMTTIFRKLQNTNMTAKNSILSATHFTAKTVIADIRAPMATTTKKLKMNLYFLKKSTPRRSTMIWQKWQTTTGF